MAKQLLFRLTRKDFDWSYFNGTGPGGQGKNKSRSAVRVRHAPSGAMAMCQDSRSKTDNEREAFMRLCATKEFKAWHKLECARRTGMLAAIEEKIEQDLHPSNLKVEVKSEDGKWVDWPEAPEEINTHQENP